MSTTRLPRCVRLLAIHGEKAFQPNFSTGRYAPPLISRRVAARMRKRAIVEGTYGSYSPNQGGWDPAWDKPRNMYVIKPWKGHKNERTREARAEKVTKAMAGMPERLSKYKQEAMERKPKKDILYMFKRVTELTKTH